MHKHPVYCEGAEEVPFADGCGCGAGDGAVGSGAGCGASAGSGAAGCGCGASAGSGAAGCGCGAGAGVRCFEGPKMVAYVNGVSEAVFKVGMCLPAGPYVSDSDVEYIVESIKEAMR